MQPEKRHGDVVDGMVVPVSSSFKSLGKSMVSAKDGLCSCLLCLDIHCFIIIIIVTRSNSNSGSSSFVVLFLANLFIFWIIIY